MPNVQKVPASFPCEFLDKFTWGSTFHSVFLHVSSVNMGAHKFHGSKHEGALTRNIRELLPDVSRLLRIREQKKRQGATRRNIREKRNYYYYYCYYYTTTEIYLFFTYVYNVRNNENVVRKHGYYQQHHCRPSVVPI